MDLKAKTQNAKRKISKRKITPVHAAAAQLTASRRLLPPSLRDDLLVADWNLLRRSPNFETQTICHHSIQVRPVLSPSFSFCFSRYFLLILQALIMFIFLFSFTSPLSCFSRFFIKILFWNNNLNKKLMLFLDFFWEPRAFVICNHRWFCETKWVSYWRFFNWLSI